MMGFFELHMICGVEEVGVEHKARDAHRALGTQTTSACLPACLTSFRFRKSRSLFLSRNPGRGEQRKGKGVSPPCPTGPSIRILTGHTVGHLSSIMKKAELPSV